MTAYAVSEEKNRWLKEKMEALNVQEKDIQEKFVRSSGKGGQEVNKTSTCVYLKHIPTGVEVKCMKDRSQSINRFLAGRVLLERIEEYSGHLSSDDIGREKLRKQKTKRKKRALAKYQKEGVMTRKHSFMLIIVLLLCPAFIWAGASSAAADEALSRGPETIVAPQTLSDTHSDTGDACERPLGVPPAEAVPIPLRQSSPLPEAYLQNDGAITVLTQAQGQEAPAAAPVENENIAEDAGKETPQIPDPLAPLNKAMFQFNDKLYFWVLKPTTQVYSHIAPEPLRLLVSNFYDNLWAPSRIINNLLQLRFKAAGNELIRFLFNSFAGTGGIGDVATPALGIKKQEADFGQTLGHYGVGQGFYLVLPVLGPSSLRDGIGLVGDEFMYPITYWSLYYHLTFWQAAGFFVHEKVNDTSFKIGEYESFKESAIDPYISMRDAYTQYRQRKVEESKQ